MFAVVAESTAQVWYSKLAEIIRSDISNFCVYLMFSQLTSRKPGISEKEYRALVIHTAYTTNVSQRPIYWFVQPRWNSRGRVWLVCPALTHRWPLLGSVLTGLHHVVSTDRRLRNSWTVAWDVSNLIAVVATHVRRATTSSTWTTATTTAAVWTVASEMSQLIAPVHINHNYSQSIHQYNAVHLTA